MRTARLTTAGLSLIACLVSASALPQGPGKLSLLSRYAAGDFDAVAAELDAQRDFQQILDDLKAHTAPWFDAAGPGDRPRRELAAATFALEAARAASWHEWKILLRPPKDTSPLPTLYWKPAPQLIEWACALLRASPKPRPIEREWQLAALAVAQRAEDPQFLIGLSKIAAVDPDLEPVPAAGGRSRSGDWGRLVEVLNKQDEIRHLEHVRARFPDERRFMLAEAIARDQVLPEEAMLGYRSLVDDLDLAGEAEMRIGALHLRRNRTADALQAFARAERLTRDPYVIHLAQVYRGQILARQNRDAAAIDAFRRALAAKPGAQSASVMLAELLIKSGRRLEAQEVMAASLAATPAGDPFLEHMHGDDRFWPELLTRLRREIAR